MQVKHVQAHALLHAICSRLAMDGHTPCFLHTNNYITHLESEAQCMAYILAKCPLRVFLALRLTLPIAGTSAATSAKEVSATAIRASYYSM